MGEGVQTHYEILEIGRHATAELVRQAYRRQAQKFHPDRQPGNLQAQQYMARINEAYAVLSDPAGRSAYDHWVDARDGLLAAERAVAEASQPRGLSASWPWFLLAGTLAFTLLSLGTVLYKELVPSTVPAFAPPAVMAGPPPGRPQHATGGAASAAALPDAGLMTAPASR
jgi:hypothetical protein